MKLSNFMRKIIRYVFRNNYNYQPWNWICNPKVETYYTDVIFLYCSRDLSATSIASLPAYGIDDIETIIVRNTHSLKTIPSIYDFQVIRRYSIFNFIFSIFFFFWINESFVSLLIALSLSLYFFFNLITRVLRTLLLHSALYNWLLAMKSK